MKTEEDIRANRKIIGAMDNYANKSGNKSLINYTAQLKKHL